MLYRVVLVVCGVFVPCLAALGQMTFTAQDRSVNATGPGAGATQAASAPNFAPFNATATSNGPTGGTASASQTSWLEASGIDATGSANGGKNASGSTGSASSSFSTTFVAGANLMFAVSGSLSFTTGSLTGPGVNINLTGGSSASVNTTGSFQAGQTYTMQIVTSGTIIGPTVFTGKYDLKLTITGATPAPQGSAFTYQGVLKGQQGGPITTPCDLQFALFPAPTGGFQIGPTLSFDAVPVVNGVFTRELDFGYIFDGLEKWLEVSVRNPAGVGVFTPVSPRVRIDATPYALFSAMAYGATTVPWTGVTGVPANVSGAFSPWTSVSGGINTGNDVSIGSPAFTPSDQLHLYSTGSNRLLIQSTGAGYAGVRTKTAGHEYFFGSNNNDQWDLYDNTVLASRIRVLPGGNVGINNISPELRLSVAGGIGLATGDYLAFGKVGNGTGTAENTDLVAFYRANLTTGGANSTELRLVIGDDNVAGPSQDYFTIGTIPGGFWNPTISFRSDGVAAKPGGGTWANISDPRTKHDITRLEGTLDRLLSLRGYQYFYNEEEVKKGRALPGLQIGLMADEVERVFPDWVTRDRDGMRMVTERSTTALMVEALRDLRAEKDTQIAERDARIRALEEQNRRVLERLEKLERAQESRK